MLRVLIVGQLLPTILTNSIITDFTVGSYSHIRLMIPIRGSHKDRFQATGNTVVVQVEVQVHETNYQEH